MRHCALIYSVLLLFVSATATAAQSRHAFIIGNDNYPGNELKNAVNDATSVYKALRAVGYDSTLVVNTDKTALSDKVERFADLLRPGDVALLYYAGHGLQLEGENYLIPTDFKATSPGAVREQGYSLSSLLERFTDHGATTQIVILDSCRDNPFLGTRSTKGGWAALGTSAGTFLAFGTSPGSTASDDSAGDHGLFTKDLLPLLTSSNLDIEGMFRQVREAVIQESNAQQVPWVASSLIGTFHVRPDLDAGASRLPRLARISSIADLSQARSLGDSVALNLQDSSSGDPEQLHIGIVRAIRLARVSRFEEAIGILQDALSIWPESSAALRLLGLILHRTGRDVEALEAIGRARKINQNDAPTAALQCAVEGLLNPYSARQVCELAARTNPSAETYLTLAATLAAVGEDSKASTAVEASIALNGSDLAFAIKGGIETREGERDAAEYSFMQAAQIALSDRKR